MFQAFFDESGSETGDKILVVAGYIHDAATWAFFADDWKLRLDKPPTIEYFHMVEAQNLRDQFSGWTPSERDAKIDAFASLIEKYQPWSIACSISQSDHNRIVKPVAPYDLRQPFVSCYLGLIIKLAQLHTSMRLNLPTDLIFDEREVTPHEADFFYEGAKSRISDPIMLSLLGNTPIFRDDKKVPALQAADLLAWHLRRQKERCIPEKDMPILKKLLPLLHAETFIDESCLRGMAHEMAQVPNRKYTTKKKDSIRKILPMLKPR
jgi:hypothetical protein